MESIINVECSNLNLFLDKKQSVNAIFVCSFSDEEKNIVVSIHEQLSDIYTNTKFNKEFVKRLEYKLKLTLKLNPAKLTFSNQDGQLYLQTFLKDIYEPVTLTPDGTKMGDKPFLVGGKILKFFTYKNKFFIECLSQEIDSVSNELTDRIITLKINDDVNNCYNSKVVKNKFKQILNKTSINKRVFLEALANYLENKSIEIEYDEYKGYTLWTVLEDLLCDDSI
ncbi:MAG: hypothetical protein K0R72_397 [Clostridia bacterium]|jgi:hypothetical protein|nr:hypothetical protein [Clostridia bacterium]